MVYVVAFTGLLGLYRVYRVDSQMLCEIKNKVALSINPKP